MYKNTHQGLVAQKMLASLYTRASWWGHTTPRTRKAGKLPVGGKFEKGSQVKGKESLPSPLWPVIQVMETHEREVERAWPPLCAGHGEAFLEEGNVKMNHHCVLISLANLFFSSYTYDQRCLVNIRLALSLVWSPGISGCTWWELQREISRVWQCPERACQKWGDGSHEDW